jgi:two-component system phosphate regulon sensor histidine kinase PhoR
MQTSSRQPDHEAPADQSTARTATSRRLRTVVFANFCLWGVLGSLASSPWTLAIIGFVAATASALYAVFDDRRRLPPPEVSGASRRVWPDSGMKTALDALDEPVFLTDLRGIVRYQNSAATARYGDSVEPVRFSERGAIERFFVAHCGPVRLPRRDQDGRADFLLIRLRDETEIVRLDRMRGDFIANASHELRTPLASLTGFVETLLGPAKNDEANRERFLKIMLEQAQRMSRLVDDLLSLTRLEMKAHVRPTERVDLAALLQLAADLLIPVAKTRQTSLVVAVDGSAPVTGDRDELTQVFSNLIENAVKYGRDGGRIDLAIAAEASDRGEAGWLVTVSDDGPGIAPEHLPRLTERFYRVDAARSRAQKGTGLGLAIVKHIVNRHDGRLQFRSELGAGTVVSVWLPAAPEA